MRHVFISYSRRDVASVDQFAEAMTRAGIEVWLDREDIRAGNSWRVQIVEAIDACSAFVLMLSGDSALSPNVHKEVILAQDSGRTIFLVMLEPVKIPAEIRYQLAGLQFIDLQLLGFEKAAAQLVAGLREHLKKIKPAGEETHKQAELVIQGVNLSAFTAEKREQLLAFLSTLTDADPAQLRIANVAAGSLHVFVDMPAAAAFQLKALALNNDPRFEQQGIVSLRLAGGALFIHTAQGRITSSPTSNPLETFFASALGKMLTVLAILILLAGLTTFNPFMRTPPASDSAPARSATADTSTPTASPSATAASSPTPTATPTLTPVIHRTLNAVVANDRIACNYGPGDLYLNDETLLQGIKLQVLGRDVNSGWAYVHADGYPNPCWVHLEYITMDGEVEDLEPVYPGKVTLHHSPYWDPPKNVYTARSKSNPGELSIYWDAFILGDGDMESPTAPRYLLELWLCRDGELAFAPYFAWENNLKVVDEAGCSEPSRGFIYLSEKHGYAGPVEIPWTPHPAP
jgi:hypothetical protein